MGERVFNLTYRTKFNPGFQSGPKGFRAEWEGEVANCGVGVATCFRLSCCCRAWPPASDFSGTFPFSRELTLP